MNAITPILGDGRVALVRGRVADRSCSGRCGGCCARVWKALPCHAGEEAGSEVCGCPSRFPTAPIYVCVGTACANGNPLGVFLAEYRELPGQLYCFGVDTSREYAIEEIPVTATVVGLDGAPPACASGCDDPRCYPTGALFVTPRQCGTAGQTPWICASEIANAGCEVYPVFPAGSSVGMCVHAIGGVLVSRLFRECPPNRAYLGSPYQTCCDCLAHVGYADDCRGFAYAGPVFPNSSADLCPPNLIGRRLACCCGVITRWSETGVQTVQLSGGTNLRTTVRGECRYAPGGQLIFSNREIEQCSFTRDPPCDPWTPLPCPQTPCLDFASAALGNPVSCTDCPSGGSTGYIQCELTGSKVVTCSGGSQNWHRRQTDVVGGWRDETVNQAVIIDRDVWASCEGGCFRSGEYPPGGGPGRAGVPGLSGGSGGGGPGVLAPKGCAGCGAGGLVLPSVEELASVVRSRV